jgi:SAM-dependent methyltransferase
MSEKTKQQDFKKSEFAEFFSGVYKIVSEKILEHLKNGDHVLDLGCQKGFLEVEISFKKKDCIILGVDIDNVAVNRFNEYNSTNIIPKVIENNNSISAIVCDANNYLASSLKKEFDFILINATLHEINDAENREDYLTDFFHKLYQTAKPGGKLVIGDYFYPPEISDEDVNDFMEHQLETIGHADAREKFVDPELLREKAEEAGLRVLEYENIRAVKEIDRRYYLFVFEKVA